MNDLIVKGSGRTRLPEPGRRKKGNRPPEEVDFPLLGPKTTQSGEMDKPKVTRSIEGRIRSRPYGKGHVTST